jgi:hypothetical protein
LAVGKCRLAAPSASRRYNELKGEQAMRSTNSSTGLPPELAAALDEAL